MGNDQDAVFTALSEPFDPKQVEWKPQAVKGDRALAIAYVDARAVMDRLDKVLGLGNWQTSYREIPDGVVCRLRVRVGGEWFEHEDVGSFSEQPDSGDRLKAAFSDGLKRVAVHVGVGRYLYSLPSTWCDYDPAKRQFARTPTLPAWALPAGSPKPSGRDNAPAAAPAADSAFLTPGFVSWLRRQDDEMFKAALTGRRCELVQLVADEVGQKEHRAEPQRWPAACREKVIQAVQAFRRQRAKAVGAKQAETAPAPAAAK